MMTPETLKLLAEALGYGTRVNDNGKLYIPVETEWSTEEILFNPEKDPAQEREVLLWLLGKGWKPDKPNPIQYVFGRYSATIFEVRHKDYTTALMMAAERELGNE